MRNKKQMAQGVLMLLLVGAMLTTACGQPPTESGEDTVVSETAEPVTNGSSAVQGLDEITLPVNTSVNPIVGNNGIGEYLYGGDPSVLVDGDTVYLYTGHDASTDGEVSRAIYNIPEYLCYSTKDLVNWQYEGVVMSMADSEWPSNKSSAWAAQVAKHYNAESGKDQYYLYYCSWDKTSNGKQSIGVAVSDSATGTFVDIGEPLVSGNLTTTQASNWEDIDPTVWIETDESGEEHRYLAWGNSKLFICELNEDMISIKDRNGDGQITFGTDAKNCDVINHQIGLSNFTEAPWLYRRCDEDGNYYGDYYLFYASSWRERMSYATTDDLFEGKWEWGEEIMDPTATSNTNHMAVFDFKGKTYFVYHNGALAGGNGYRRSACIVELTIEDDGYIDTFEESTSAIAGNTVSLLTLDGQQISHAHFNNSGADDAYPYVDVQVGIMEMAKASDAAWVLVPGKADTGNGAYVSIESENKTGLYITAREDLTVTLAQDTAATQESADACTFRTLSGAADADGITFESVAYPGMFLTMSDGILTLSDGMDAASCTFYVK